MKSKNIILRVLTFLILIALVIFFAQIALGGNLTNLKLINTQTVAAETGFVVDIPQKALLKNYVVVSAQAAPGTRCELLFVPPSGEIQKMEAVANDNGRCIWRWKLDESQGKGNGRLIFTIDDKSETHFFEIRSSF